VLYVTLNRRARACATHGQHRMDRALCWPATACASRSRAAHLWLVPWSRGLSCLQRRAGARLAVADSKIATSPVGGLRYLPLRMLWAVLIVLFRRVIISALLRGGRSSRMH
jgi:hypothetical protein